ncbi:hypothetical protein RRF57_012341 [Xylaria bambusicola]|uniref:F-box domain-containing protein n=1 Tax=Xylaria bambusicola TaxID=326684 RepID=A0AAN7V424_9PEZI
MARRAVTSHPRRKASGRKRKPVDSFNKGDPNDITSKPLTSPILELPYELWLAIFHQLPDQPSIEALASAHPFASAVYRQNKQSIHKAMRWNLIAEVTLEATGYASLQMAQIYLLICALEARTLTPEQYLEVATSFLGDSWVPSESDVKGLTSKTFENRMQGCVEGAKQLERWGFFDDGWTLPERRYKQRIIPNALKNGPRPKLVNIMVLMIIDLWTYVAHPRNSHAYAFTLSLPGFLGFFSPDLTRLVTRFAQNYLESVEENAGVNTSSSDSARAIRLAWKRFQHRHKLFCFPFDLLPVRPLARLYSKLFQEIILIPVQTFCTPPVVNVQARDIPLYGMRAPKSHKQFILLSL